jgi:hypothetical protein
MSPASIIKHSEITDFVLEHYPASQMWEPGSLANWIKWAAWKEFLFLVWDEERPAGKRLAGMAIAKPMALGTEYEMRPNDKYDEEGQAIYVDLAIATKKEAIKAICIGLYERFGDRPVLAFFRYDKSNDNLKVYDFQEFRKKLLG